MLNIRYKSKKFPPTIQNVARRKLRMIAATDVIEDLRIPSGNHLEELKGDLDDFYSIRINEQWRIIFTFQNEGAENVTDYHK